MNFGISTASLYPMLTEQSLMEIGKHGVKNAEVFLNTYSEVETGFVKELKEIADFYDMRISSVHPFTCAFEPFLLFTGYERRFKDGLASYRTYFEAMNILNANIFVFHGDRMASVMPNEQYFERFAQLRDIGKEYGITVAQENVERCKSRSVDFLEAMAGYLNGDLAIVFDNKQAVRSGVYFGDFIERFAKYIVHVHISDNGVSSDCLPIGEGAVDFELLLGLLKARGFNKSCVVELYRDILSSDEQVFKSFFELNRIYSNV